MPKKEDGFLVNRSSPSFSTTWPVANITRKSTPVAKKEKHFSRTRISEVKYWLDLGPKENKEMKTGIS